MKHVNQLILLSLCCCIYMQCQAPVSPESTESSEPKASIERGEYLLATSGCHDCHTPKKMTEMGPVPDMSQMLSGYPAGRPMPLIDKALIEPGKWVLFTQDLLAAVGPWGVSYSANLTPHESGLGTWTYENFKVAMTEGKHKGMLNGRPILPPMPWQELKNLTPEDLESMFLYLQSIPPIDNVVPSPMSPTEL